MQPPIRRASRWHLPARIRAADGPVADAERRFGTGTLSLGELTGPVTGVVENRLLTLRGTVGSGSLKAATVHWSSRVMGGTMDGVAAYRVELTGLPGTGVLVTTMSLKK